MKVDLAIVGAGPAGLSAAIYARRAGLSVLVLESGIYGGQVANTPEVENYPGIAHITGVEFCMSLYNQAISHGAEVELDALERAELSGEVKLLHTATEQHEAGAVIIANGAKRRKLGCPGEEELSGKGVSYCATCDGAFFRGMEVAIVGGGDTALEDALFLSNNCSKVYLIHRRDQFRGSRILADAVAARGNIEILYDTTIERIEGTTKVERAIVVHKKTDEQRTLEVAAVFVAVGLVPDNSLFAGEITLDEAGYVVAGENCKTNLLGVYAAGDTRTKTLRQIVTAAADGAVAAFEVASYLATHSL